MKRYWWVATWPILLPLAWVWAVVTKLRRKFAPSAYQSSLPVISVGNLHSGGSGKTPFIARLAQFIGPERVVILSRGYRSRPFAKQEKLREVELGHAKATEEFGDEPVLLKRWLSCPVYIAPDRAAAVKVLEKVHPQKVVLLDDGFQHLALGRAIDLVLINSAKDPDAAYCLPCGELREPISSVASASAVVFIDDGSGGLGRWKDILAAVAPSVPQFVVDRRLQPLPMELKAKRAGMLCAIAEPEGFERLLSDKVTLAAKFVLPDHEPFTPDTLQAIYRWVKRESLDLVATTEKDAARLPETANLTIPVWVAALDHKVPEAFWQWLSSKGVFR